MRLRLVLPVLAAAGLIAPATFFSYAFATDYGAYDGGPLAWVGAGLYVLWPVVVVVGVLAGVVPHQLGERRAARPAAVVMVLLAVVGIGAGSAWGTRERAALNPTVPVCPVGGTATPGEAASIGELADVLADLDHPTRFDAGSATSSPERCRIAFSGGDDPRRWVPTYRSQLEARGWEVTTPGAAPYELVVAVRDGLRIRVLDHYGDHGAAGLCIDRL